MSDTRSSHETTPAGSTNLLWVDCEFTGLDPTEGHKIIEIGALVTDLALNELDVYSTFIQYDWAETERLMDRNPWWNGRDQDRLRMQAGMATGRTVFAVDTDLVELTQVHFPTTQPTLFGNSLANDKRHIEDQLPRFASGLHYRVVDVSSFKVVAQLYRGTAYGGKTNSHHALDDIRESVDEFRFLMTQLGIADLTQI